jgi:hypothetical protein
MCLFFIAIILYLVEKGCYHERNGVHHLSIELDFLYLY